MFHFFSTSHFNACPNVKFISLHWWMLLLQFLSWFSKFFSFIFVLYLEEHGPHDNGLTITRISYDKKYCNFRLDILSYHNFSMFTLLVVFYFSFSLFLQRVHYFVKTVTKLEKGHSPKGNHFSSLFVIDFMVSSYPIYPPHLFRSLRFFFSLNLLLSSTSFCTSSIF